MFASRAARTAVRAARVPVEKWTQEVNAGEKPAEHYFVMKNLAARIDELVAAKGA